MRGPDPSLRDRLAAAVIERSSLRTTTAVSRLMGRAARLALPPAVSRLAVRGYVRAFGVDLAEVDPDQLNAGFPSFDAFFTRTLRSGARSIDERPQVLVSPSDGRLRDFSRIEDRGVVVAKGHAYTIGELLADAELAAAFVGGWQAVIYLHPRDYHRVHAPVAGQLQRSTCVPGRLLPVNDAALAREPRLFALNERHVHLIASALGRIAVVMVAAFGVGHMSCAHHQLEAHPESEQRIDFDPPPELTKGGDLGVFHLGSTVVLLTEPGLRPLPSLRPGQHLELGQALLERGDGEGA